MHNTRSEPPPPSGLLAVDQIHHGDCRELLPKIAPNSVALSVWSPPYFVGKSYEKDLTFAAWEDLLAKVIRQHHPVLKPGGFLVVNIADILCFADPAIPRIQAESHGGNRLPLTREDVLRAQAQHPDFNRYQLAELLGVSEQTIDRRLKNNNIRGGKYAPQTRVKLVGCLLEEAAYSAGLYLYDRRIWVKDAAWENSRWHSGSYRAVDEFEYLYFFWKPGITKVARARPAGEGGVAGVGLPGGVALPLGAGQRHPRGEVPGRAPTAAHPPADRPRGHRARLLHRQRDHGRDRDRNRPALHRDREGIAVREVGPQGVRGRQKVPLSPRPTCESYDRVAPSTTRIRSVSWARAAGGTTPRTDPTPRRRSRSCGKTFSPAATTRSGAGGSPARTVRSPASPATPLTC